MTSPDRWTQFEQSRRPLGPDPEVDIKYGIAFDWGALHVSTQADDSYGFKPLVPGVIKGNGIDVLSTPETITRTDVYLLGPQEIKKQVDEVELERHFSFMGNTALGTANIHKKGIELKVGLENGASVMSESIVSAIGTFVEGMGSNVDDVTDENNIPITESIDHQAPQILIHELSAFTGALVDESFTEYTRMINNKRTLRSVTAVGAVALGTGGLVLGTDVAQHGSAHTETIGLALADMSIYGFMAINMLRRQFKMANFVEGAIRDTAERYGMRVGDDIHKSYCVTHFDDQHQAMMDQQS